MLKYVNSTRIAVLVKEIGKSIITFIAVLAYLMQVLFLANMLGVKIYVNVSRVSILTSIDFIQLDNYGLTSIILVHLLALATIFGLNSNNIRSAKIYLAKLIDKLFMGFAVLAFSTIFALLAYGTRSTLTLTLLLMSVLLASIIHLVIGMLNAKYYSIALSSAYIVSIIHVLVNGLTGANLGILSVLSKSLLYILYLSYPLTMVLLLLYCIVCLSTVALIIVRPGRLELDRAPRLKINKFKIQYLAMIASVASLIYVLPYLTLINKLRYFVSVDIVYYSKWINLMNMYGPFKVILMHNDRPLFLLILYYMNSVFNTSLGITLILVGLLSTILLVLGVFLLTKAMFSDENLGITSAILVILSHQLLAFIYGGFYANYLALSLSYIALALTLKYSNSSSLLKWLLIFALSSVMIALVHLWTWMYTTLVLVLYLILRLIVERYVKSSDARRVALALMFSFILLVLGAIYTYVYALSKPVHSVVSRFTLLSINGLTRVFTYYLWGVLNNPFYYFFPLLFTLNIMLNRVLPSKQVLLLISMYSITSLVLLPYLSNEVIVLRLLMNTPFYIATAYYLNNVRSIWFKLAVLSVLLYWSLYNIINAVPG